MKVIIAGSRDIGSPPKTGSVAPTPEQIEEKHRRDYQAVKDAILDSKLNVTEVVSGRAQGVDRLGEIYALDRGKRIKFFPADWKKHGKSAGPIRNAEMAEYADALIAIWDGESRGTRNMIETMEKLGKPLYVRVMKQ